MEAGSLPEWRTVARPRNWRRLRGPPRAADRRFLPFWLLSHCYFLLPIGDDSRSL